VTSSKKEGKTEKAFHWCRILSVGTARQRRARHLGFQRRPTRARHQPRRLHTWYVLRVATSRASVSRSIGWRIAFRWNVHIRGFSTIISADAHARAKGCCSYQTYGIPSTRTNRPSRAITPEACPAKYELSTYNPIVFKKLSKRGSN
jgi:hypothetical protein